MKTIFNVKKIAILALIFIFALSIPLSVSAKPGGGNQGNQGNQEKSDKANSDEVSESVETDQADDADETSNSANKNKGQQQKEKQEERKELRDQLKEAKNLHKEMSKEARDKLRTEAEEQVSMLEAEGDLDQAFEIQTELVQLDLKNKGAYKKLGHLYDKGKGSKGTKVFVNGSHPVFDTPPVIRDGRTLIPLRAISKALNAEIDWNAEERKVTTSRDGITIELYIGEGTAYINGEEVSLDVPANIENSRTYVPFRFIGEAFNAHVDWEEETGSVIIVDESDEAATEEDEEGTEEEATEGEEGTEDAVEDGTVEGEGTEEVEEEIVNEEDEEVTDAI